MHDRPQAPSQPDPLGALLAGGRTVVLDGGLATELEAGGADLSDALWSARLLVEDPDAIVRAHLAFFRAGAQVATTASYQASFEGFARRGIDADAAAGLMRRSVELARDAAAIVRRERGEATRARPLLVAASVGPYGAFLADGSEYRGRYGLSVAALRDFHRRRMAVLLDAEPDLLAMETIPEIEEGEALATLLDELGGTRLVELHLCGRSAAPERRSGRGGVRPRRRRARASWRSGSTARPPSTRSSSSSGPPPPPPSRSSSTRTAARTGIPVGRRWTGSRHPVDGAAAGGWIAAGARIVGGCCRVTPAQIGDMAASLRAAA